MCFFASPGRWYTKWSYNCCFIVCIAVYSQMLFMLWHDKQRLHLYNVIGWVPQGPSKWNNSHPFTWVQCSDCNHKLTWWSLNDMNRSKHVLSNFWGKTDNYKNPRCCLRTLQRETVIKQKSRAFFLCFLQTQFQSTNRVRNHVSFFCRVFLLCL